MRDYANCLLKLLNVKSRVHRNNQMHTNQTPGQREFWRHIFVYDNEVLDSTEFQFISLSTNVAIPMYFYDRTRQRRCSLNFDVRQ